MARVRGGGEGFLRGAPTRRPARPGPIRRSARRSRRAARTTWRRPRVTAPRASISISSAKRKLVRSASVPARTPSSNHFVEQARARAPGGVDERRRDRAAWRATVPAATTRSEAVAAGSAARPRARRRPRVREARRARRGGRARAPRRRCGGSAAQELLEGRLGVYPCGPRPRRPGPGSRRRRRRAGKDRAPGDAAAGRAAERGAGSPARGRAPSSRAPAPRAPRGRARRPARTC